MVGFIAKIFCALNNNSNPGEIAHGVAIALFLGLLPKDNVFWYILAVLFLFIRINKGALMLFTALFAFIAPNFDHIFDELGYYILTLPKLQDFYTSLMNIPFVAFTKFNNTIVMGSFISSVVLYIPAYFLTRLFVFLWRSKLAPLVMQTKVVIFIKELPFVQKITDVADDATDLVDRIKKWDL